MTQSSYSEPLAPSDVFAPEHVAMIEPGSDKPEVLRLLVETLANASRIEQEHVDAITAALLSREQVATTGMGKGLAFPHLRSHLLLNFCGAIGAALEGIDFDSLDRQPTRLVVLMLSPFEARAEHAEILGKLCSLLSHHTLQYSLQTPRPPAELLSFLGLS